MYRYKGPVGRVNRITYIVEKGGKTRLRVSACCPTNCESSLVLYIWILHSISSLFQRCVLCVCATLIVVSVVWILAGVL